MLLNQLGKKLELAPEIAKGISLSLALSFVRMLIWLTFIAFAVSMSTLEASANVDIKLRTSVTLSVALICYITSNNLSREKARVDNSINKQIDSLSNTGKKIFDEFCTQAAANSEIKAALEKIVSK